MKNSDRCTLRNSFNLQYARASLQGVPNCMGSFLTRRTTSDIGTDFRLINNTSYTWSCQVINSIDDTTTRDGQVCFFFIIMIHIKCTSDYSQKSILNDKLQVAWNESTIQALWYAE